MKKWISNALARIGRLFGKTERRPSVLTVTRMEEVDKDCLESSVIYVESRGGLDRWLHLKCPCGCADVISLNLMTNHRPFWSITWHGDGTLTVMPSVDKTSGCRSHFFIRRCRIAWASSAVTN
jgi:uncharacterized protein DUF6527